MSPIKPWGARPFYDVFPLQSWPPDRAPHPQITGNLIHVAARLSCWKCFKFKVVQGLDVLGLCFSLSTGCPCQCSFNMCLSSMKILAQQLLELFKWCWKLAEATSVGPCERRESWAKSSPHLQFFQMKCQIPSLPMRRNMQCLAPSTLAINE